MKNDPRRVALPGTQATDTMAKADPVNPARAPDRPVMHGKYHSISLRERNHLYS